MATAMSQPVVDSARTKSFLQTLVHCPTSEGGKEVWPCLQAGLITEIEARNLVMAHCASWLSNANRVSEPSHESWGSAALDAGFDNALFGRAARA